MPDPDGGRRGPRKLIQEASKLNGGRENETPPGSQPALQQSLANAGKGRGWRRTARRRKHEKKRKKRQPERDEKQTDGFDA